MSMNTNLQGRLRNISLPLRNSLLPLFEAVVNSIHAIEEAQLSSQTGNIIVEIIRSPQKNVADFVKKSGQRKTIAEVITGFRVTDNGIGFNEENMKSFLTLDSEYKIDKGGRGVGRLLWLKTFKRVTVNSTFNDSDGEFITRNFTFTVAKGVDNWRSYGTSQDKKRETTIHLDGFIRKYRKASPKTTRAIANSLFEHCLWYFVREGGAPKIVIEDNGEYIDLDDVYTDHMVSSADNESISIKNNIFDLTHIKLRANSSNSHIIAFCATNRLVKEESLMGKIPGLYGRLTDDNSEFVYACYVTSPFLDKTVRSERTDFDIIEDPGELFKQTEISFGEIRGLVIERASAYLSNYLEKNRAQAKDRIENFVSQKAPRYRPILERIPEEKLIVDPNISDKELDLTLHKHLAEIEEELLAEGHNVMAPKEGELLSAYQDRLHEYLKKAEDIKKSDLANYIFHRRVILELLEKAIQKGADGKYAREDLIHSLIMPMRVESNDIMPDSCNLWLIDERLAFHDYLASDKTLASMPITSSTETKEPDIVALNVFDNPILVSEGHKLPLASIIVVEIKRPMRNDASAGEEKDPIEQAIGYLDRIRNGKVQTASARPIPHSMDIPGFCYVICDITPSIEKRCRLFGLTPTHDHLGYFGYNPNFKAYLEVISFDRLVNAAKERNKAFFDQLGLPTA